MAMQPGATVVPDKTAAQWYNPQQQQQQQPPPPHQQMDEKKALLLWLRGEFAAANAIIDALCHHLRAVGGPGEYDGVIGSIQQRRCNWNPVLHMQQYFPVTEVVYSLQQVGWRREQKPAGLEGRMGGGGGKDFRRGGRGQRVGVEVQKLGGEMTNGKYSNNAYAKSNVNGNGKLDGGDKANVEEKGEKKDSSEMKQGSTQGAFANADDKEDAVGDVLAPTSEKHNFEVSPRSFTVTETCEGKLVNIAEGMKLYENLLDDSEISKLNTLVNTLRASGRRGQLHGQTFIVSKRPMKGRGREFIQLGVPIADAPFEDESAARTNNDLKTEPIPALLQDAIDWLRTEQVVSIKPDAAIIDIFNEGDYSQPHIIPHWFGKPVCVLFLTECEMSFGKIMAVDNPGDYRGALNLSLSPGSMLEMRGRSADFTRHAIPSTRKQRILITLVKSQPKRTATPAQPSSNWAPPQFRPPGPILPMAPQQHFVPVPTNGVLTPQQLPPPPANGMQPLFVPAPLAFSSPVALPPPSAGWPPARNPPPPRLPVPGTGVFLPPGKSSNQPPSAAATENIIAESAAVLEENGVGKSVATENQNLTAESAPVLEENGVGKPVATENQNLTIESLAVSEENGVAKSNGVSQHECDCTSTDVKEEESGNCDSGKSDEAI
ncbi:hypothetical protein ABFS83_05G050700 [Erythranthe nasuta]